jgi:uncharacterized repeat protein (TIGR01451 family)
MSDGTVWSWGENTSGQTGDGRVLARTTFQAIVAAGSPDLALSKTHSGTLRTGENGSYTLTVTNVGQTATSGPTTVVDVLPAGLAYVSATGAGWSCSAVGQTVTCTNPNPIAPSGASSISLTVRFNTLAYPGKTNVATVSNATDLNAANNTAGDPAAIDKQADRIGVTGVGYSIQDATGNFAWDGAPPDRFIYWGSGAPGEVLVFGDWNGDGRTKIGVYRDGEWLLDYNGNGVWEGTPADKIVYFGSPGFAPVVGDWNGSGTTKVGVYKDGTWILDYNGNFQWDAGIDKFVYFGSAGQTPVLGDWNGSGSTKIGVYQDGLWVLDYNGNDAWDGLSVDKLLYFGAPGQTPVVGDWNGSGSSKTGVYQDGLWVLDYNGNYAWDGLSVDKLLYFGATGQYPVLGDWNGSGTTKIGIYKDGLWVIDYNGSLAWDGLAIDKLFYFGAPGQSAVLGVW